MARELDNLRNVKLIKFDGEAHPRIRSELGITQYPSIKLFAYGACIAHATHAEPHRQCCERLPGPAPG